MARVLLVEDDDDIRETTALRLRMNGYDVIAVGDAAQAMAARGDGFDVAVVDIELPGESGIDLVHHLRADPVTAGTRVVFYTSHWSAAVAQEAGELADAYITKGQTAARLLDTVAGLAR